MKNSYQLGLLVLVLLYASLVAAALSAQTQEELDTTKRVYCLLVDANRGLTDMQKILCGFGTAV